MDDLPDSLEAFRESTTARVQRESARRGNTLGWRLLSCPWSNIETASVVLVDLHPGGSQPDPDHDGPSAEGGSAYLHESWDGEPPGTAPLQRRVVALLALAGEDPDAVLSGHLVPFRSPSFADLPRAGDAVRFGRALWSDILSRSPATLVITLGAPPRAAMAAVLGIDHLTPRPSGWDRIAIRTGEAGGRRLVALPHLSRFNLMSGEPYVSAVRAALGPRSPQAPG